MNELELIVRPHYTPRRLISKLCLSAAKLSLTLPIFRHRLLKWGGVRIATPCFVGSDVEFDNMHPELIQIGHDCVITTGVKILTHFYNTENRLFYKGKVCIGNHVFIGLNSLIIQPVNIGNNVIIGAGSVVTCDIPSDQMWAGSPARFIKSIPPIDKILDLQKKSLSSVL